MTTKRPAPLTWADARVTMLPDGLRYTMPVTDSVNHAYATVRGRRVKSKSLRTALSCAQLMFPKTPLDGDVMVRITWYRERRSGDVDNRTKATLDLLKGLAWHDDKQVGELRIVRVDDLAEPPRVEVVVTPWRPRETA